MACELECGDIFIIQISYWWSIGTEPLSLTVCEIHPLKHIWETALTF